jgi:GxxExxY protein
MTRKGPDGLHLLEGELTGEIIGAFYECYNELGFNRLESVYRRAMAIELRIRGLRAAVEAPVEVHYKGVPVGFFRLDLLVEGRVVVEVKATSVLGPTDKRQLLNYLRASNLEVGLLLHFGPEPKFHRFATKKIPGPRAKFSTSHREDPALSVPSVSDP